MARKHKCRVDELAGLAETLQAKLGALKAAGDTLSELKKAVIEKREKFEIAAKALSKARKKAAAKLMYDAGWHSKACIRGLRFP